MSRSKSTEVSSSQNRKSAKKRNDADNTAETAASDTTVKALGGWIETRANMQDSTEKEGFYPADYVWLLYRLGQLTEIYQKEASIDRLLGGTGSRDIFRELVGQAKKGSKMDFRQGGPFRGGGHGGKDNEKIKNFYFEKLDAVYGEIIVKKKVDCTSINGLSGYATQRELSDVSGYYAAIWVVQAHCKDFDIHIKELDKTFDNIDRQYNLKTEITKKQHGSGAGVAEGQSAPDNPKEMSDKQLEQWWGDICDALREKFELRWPRPEGTTVPQKVVESFWNVTPTYSSAQNLLKEEADDSLEYTCRTPRITPSLLKGELLEQKGRTPPILACGPLTNIQFVEAVFPDEFVALLVAHLGKGAEQEDKALEHAVEVLFEPTRDDEFALAASEHFLQNEGLPFARLVERCDTLCDGADEQAFYDCVEVLFGVEWSSDSCTELYSGFLNYANGSVARGFAFMIIVALLGIDRRLVIERIVSQRLAQNVHPCN